MRIEKFLSQNSYLKAQNLASCFFLSVHLEFVELFCSCSMEKARKSLCLERSEKQDTSYSCTRSI